MGLERERLISMVDLFTKTICGFKQFAANYFHTNPLTDVRQGSKHVSRIFNILIVHLNLLIDRC